MSSNSFVIFHVMTKQINKLLHVFSEFSNNSNYKSDFLELFILKNIQGEKYPTNFAHYP